LAARTVDNAKFEQLHVQLLGISASNPFSQKTFADSLKLTYPLLSDYPDMKVIRQYGMLQYRGEAKRPMARPSFFLIDKQGIIRGVWTPEVKEGEIIPSDPFLEVARGLEEKS
jgi:peroxiredoxin